MSHVNSSLLGRRVLVVEPSYLLCSDLCDILRRRGTLLLGPAATEAQAHDIISANVVDVVIFNAILRDGAVPAVLAFRLAAWRIPSLLLTNCHLPPAHPLRHGRPELVYPFAEHALDQAMDGLLVPPELPSFWTSAPANLP